MQGFREHTGGPVKLETISTNTALYFQVVIIKLISQFNTLGKPNKHGCIKKPASSIGSNLYCSQMSWTNKKICTYSTYTYHTLTYNRFSFSKGVIPVIYLMHAILRKMNYRYTRSTVNFLMDNFLFIFILLFGLLKVLSHVMKYSFEKI